MKTCSRVIPGTPKDMKPPYSKLPIINFHTIPISLGILMGVTLPEKKSAQKGKQIQGLYPKNPFVCPKNPGLGPLHSYSFRMGVEAWILRDT